MFHERGVIVPGLREYLLSITAAAVICAIVKHMVGEKKNTGKLVYVISGLFMIITIVSPVMQFRFGDLRGYLDGLQADGQYICEEGKKMATDELKNIIKEQTEAYILNEAERLDTRLDVEVTLSDSYPPQPNQVVLKGSVSPYQKQSISQYMSEYLGISQEQQIWK